MKQVLKYEYQPTNHYFKVGLTYTIKRNKVSVQNSPFGIGPIKEYNYFSILKKYNYYTVYNPKGFEDDYMSFYFHEEET